MEYMQYTTKGEERWDNIAYAAYGEASMSKTIIEANPIVNITDVIPMGTLLNIPILEQSSLATNPDLLPPWKRNL